MSFRSHNYSELFDIIEDRIPDDDSYAKVVRNFSKEKMFNDRMKVYLRLRPLNEKEAAHSSCDSSSIVVLDDQTVQTEPPQDSRHFKSNRTNKKLSYQFRFSHIYNSDVNQSDFFKNTTLDLVTDFLKGHNCMIFSYGVTNSGKTFTIQGERDHPGIIPRALSVIFDHISRNQFEHLNNFKPYMFSDVIEVTEPEIARDLREKASLLSSISEKDRISINSLNEQVNEICNENIDVEIDLSSDCNSENIRYSVWVSCLEIYNEHIFDLLDELPIKKAQQRSVLKLSEDKNGNPFVKGLKEIQVSSAEEAYQILLIGQRNLHKACTLMNHCSSRSHCIFTIKLLKICEGKNTTSAAVSMFSLCDLAGSERHGSERVSGERIKETGNINSSLMCLGRCIEALRQNQLRSSTSIIPFRDSKLTRLFQNYFMGNGEAVMIVNVSPSSQFFDETFHVLKFSTIASQVFSVPNKPVVLVSESSRNTIAWAYEEVEEQEETEVPSTHEEGEYDAKALLDIIQTKNDELKLLQKQKIMDEIRIRDEVSTTLNERFTEILASKEKEIAEKEWEREDYFEMKIRMLLECQPNDNECKRRLEGERSDKVRESYSDDYPPPSIILCRELQRYSEMESVLDCTQQGLVAARETILERDQDIASLKEQTQLLSTQQEELDREISLLKQTHYTTVNPCQTSDLTTVSLPLPSTTTEDVDPKPASMPSTPLVIQSKHNSAKHTITSMMRQKRNTPRTPGENQHLCKQLNMMRNKKLSRKLSRKFVFNKKVKRLSKAFRPKTNRCSALGEVSFAVHNDVKTKLQDALQDIERLQRELRELSEQRVDVETGLEKQENEVVENSAQTSFVELNSVATTTHNPTVETTAVGAIDVETSDVSVEVDFAEDNQCDTCSERRSLQERLTSLECDINLKEKTIMELRKYVEEKESEIREMRSSKDSQLKDYNEREHALINGFNAEIENYKRQLAKLKNSHEDDLAKRSLELKQLRVDLETEKINYAGELQSQIESFENELFIKNEEVEKLKVEVSHSEEGNAQLRTLQEQVSHLKTEKLSLQADINDLDDKNNVYFKELTVLKLENSNFVNKISSLESDLTLSRQLQTEMQTLSSSRDDKVDELNNYLQLERKEKDLIIEENKSIMDKCENLQSELRLLQEQMAQIEMVSKQKIDQLENEKNCLTSKAKETDSLWENIESLEKDKSCLKEEVTNNLNKLQNLENDISKCNEQISELEENLQLKINECNQQVEELKTMKEKEQQMVDNETHNRVLQELKTVQDSLELITSQLNERSDQIVSYRGSYDELVEKLERERVASTNIKSELTTSRQEVQTLKAAMAEQEYVMESQDVIINQKDEELINLKNEVKSSTDRCANMSEELTKQKTERTNDIEALSTENADLLKNIELLNEKLKELDTANETLASVSSKLQNSDESNRKLKDRAKEYHQEIQELEKLLSESRNELKSSKGRHDQTLSDLNRENSDLILALKKDLEKAVDCKLELEKEVADLQIKWNKSNAERDKEMQDWHLQRDKVITSLESKLKKKDEEIRNLTDNNVRLNEISSDLQEQCEHQRTLKIDAQHELQKALKAKDQIIAELRNSNFTLQDQISGNVRSKVPLSKSEMDDEENSIPKMRKNRKRHANDARDVVYNDKVQLSSTEIGEDVMPLAQRNHEQSLDLSSVNSPRVLRSNRKRNNYPEIQGLDLTPDPRTDTNLVADNAPVRTDIKSNTLPACPVGKKHFVREKVHSFVKLLDAVRSDRDTSSGSSSAASKEKHRKLTRPNVSAPFDCQPYAQSDAVQTRLRSRHNHT